MPRKRDCVPLAERFRFFWIFPEEGTVVWTNSQRRTSYPLLPKPHHRRAYSGGPRRVASNFRTHPSSPPQAARSSSELTHPVRPRARQIFAARVSRRRRRALCGVRAERARFVFQRFFSRFPKRRAPEDASTRGVDPRRAARRAVGTSTTSATRRSLRRGAAARPRRRSRARLRPRTQLGEMRRASLASSSERAARRKISLRRNQH